MYRDLFDRFHYCRQPQDERSLIPGTQTRVEARTTQVGFELVGDVVAYRFERFPHVLFLYHLGQFLSLLVGHRHSPPLDLENAVLVSHGVDSILPRNHERSNS